jgi:hypothetical protein
MLVDVYEDLAGSCLLWIDRVNIGDSDVPSFEVARPAAFSSVGIASLEACSTLASL